MGSRFLKIRQRWTLSQEAFDLLLSSLDADRVRAGDKYESLRRRIVRFFEWRGAAFPDDCADEVLNILARRLTEGERIDNLAGYSAGVSRMVLFEKQREQETERSFPGEPVFSPPDPEDDAAGTARLAALEHCLRALPPESRDLILAYYQEDKRKRIETRKQLAERLGLPLNALRIRAYRIREQLEACMTRTLGITESPGK